MQETFILCFMLQKHLGIAKLSGDEFYVCVFCFLVHIYAHLHGPGIGEG